MATAAKLSKEERATLSKGLDMIIASNARTNARETNPEIRSIREKDNEKVVVLKNKLLTLELEL